MSAAKLTDDALRAQIRLAVANATEDIEARFIEHADDPERVKAAMAAVMAGSAKLGGGADDLWTPHFMAFDFDAPDPPVDWIVARRIERGTAGMLSGDTGTAKSIVQQSLIPAALMGEPWLEAATHIDRVSVVDEENSERLVRSRLRALGMGNDLRDRLRYTSRQGIALGDRGRSDEWIREHLDAFRPDLFIIDTLMAACDVADVNSNPEAVRIWKFLRGLATEYECGILLLHHERKQSADYPESRGQAAMGARQWAGQADFHMTMAVESEFHEEPAETEGHTTTRRAFQFLPAEKDRDGRVNALRRIAVTSERDERGRYQWMRVEDEGPISSGKAEDAHRVKILVTLRDAEGGIVARKELAAACGDANPSEPDGTFKRAAAAAIQAGHIEKVGRRFQLTKAGREEALLIP